MSKMSLSKHRNQRHVQSALRQEQGGSSSRLFHTNRTMQQRGIRTQQSIQQFLQSQNQLKIYSFKESLSTLPYLETIEFEDSSRYYGQIVEESIREGIGIFETEEGDMYLGDWVNDTYHGYGMYIYHDGERYQGQLQEGFKEGVGKYFYLNGTVYQGEWKEDQRQGNGTQTDILKGVFYQGQWKNDQKQGQGRLFTLLSQNSQQILLLDGLWSNNKFTSGFINSEQYQGQYSVQSISGKGTFKFADGSVYKGEFQNNMIHGEGTYYYVNGDIYTGQFYCGLKSGKGVYKYFTGDVYEGQYKKDLKSGYGKFMFINGNYYVGEFQRDNFSGKGKYYFTKDQVISGYWENGKVLNADDGKDIGIKRNITLATQRVSPLKTQNQLRSKSPLRYSPSLPQIQGRSYSPLNRNGLSRNQSTMEKQEKASIISMNQNGSAIRNQMIKQNHKYGQQFYPNMSKNIPIQSPSRQIMINSFNPGQYTSERDLSKLNPNKNDKQFKTQRDLRKVQTNYKEEDQKQPYNLFQMMTDDKDFNTERSLNMDTSLRKVEEEPQMNKRNKRRLQY